MARKNKGWQMSAFGWKGITGVYCVCVKDQFGKTVVHYIGSSKDIGKRVMNPKHPYRRIYNKQNAFIKFKECDNYIELEREMIKRIKPLFNTQHT